MKKFIFEFRGRKFFATKITVCDDENDVIIIAEDAFNDVVNYYLANEHLISTDEHREMMALDQEIYCYAPREMIINDSYEELMEIYKECK